MGAVGDVVRQIHDRCVEGLVQGLVMLCFVTTENEFTKPCSVGLREGLQYPVQDRLVCIEYTLGRNPVIDLDHSLVGQIRLLK